MTFRSDISIINRLKQSVDSKTVDKKTSIEGDKLSADEIKFYNDNGYVLIKGVFKSKVDELKEAADRLVKDLENIPPKLDGSDTFVNYKGAVAVLQREPESKVPVTTIQRVVWSVAAEPAFLACSRDPKITRRVQQLLGSGEEKTASHLIGSFHPKNTEKTEFGFHQDSQNRAAIKGRKKWEDGEGKNFVQTFIAIDKSSKENGVVYVYPKSQQNGFLKFEKQYQSQDKFEAALQKRGLHRKDLSEPIMLSMEPGDLVLMHPHLIHFSKPNQTYSDKSGARRDLLISGFAKMGANSGLYPGEGSAVEVSLVTGEPVIRKRLNVSNHKIHCDLLRNHMFPNLQRRKWSARNAAQSTRAEYQSMIGDAFPLRGMRIK
jgi:hypothetical protein